ncbi:hypothetical protein ES703_60816 [subsurface metagenome]
MLLVGVSSLASSSTDHSASRNVGETAGSISDEAVLHNSDLELPDKVYTFSAPTYNWTFNSLYLEKEYMYFIYIELVTPHNCSTMRITIWDPHNKQYNIFENKTFYYPEYGRYFEIPFGTEMSGGHKFEFYSESNVNFNMYIKIEQGPLCLHDKIDSQYHDDVVFFEVTNFSNGQSKSHRLDLETDVSYKFYIGRVSAISTKESKVVRLDYIIEDSTDPDPIEFIIYSNDLLADIDGVSMFNFGTAIGGEYKIKLKIYCEVEHVNIAYAVIEDYQISDVVDTNKTQAPDEEDSESIDLLEELSSDSISLPIEGTVAVILFAGGMASTVYVMSIKLKKKGNVSLPIAQKK